jgi:hypothetical protein
MEEEIKNTSDADNKNTRSRKHDFLKRAIIGLAVFFAMLVIFGTGIFVGEMKARFSYRWAENYHRNFGGPPGGFMGNLRMPPPPDNEFVESHGIFGQIIKIGDSDFVIKGQDNAEKVVVINKDTAINSGKKTITKADLRVGEQVVVIGSPNSQGQIDAKLIRVFGGSTMMVPQINI